MTICPLLQLNQKSKLSGLPVLWMFKKKDHVTGNNKTVVFLRWSFRPWTSEGFRLWKVKARRHEAVKVFKSAVRKPQHSCALGGVLVAAAAVL